MASCPRLRGGRLPAQTGDDGSDCIQTKMGLSRQRSRPGCLNPRGGQYRQEGDEASHERCEKPRALARKDGGGEGGKVGEGVSNGVDIGVVLVEFGKALSPLGEGGGLRKGGKEGGRAGGGGMTAGATRASGARDMRSVRAGGEGHRPCHRPAGNQSNRVHTVGAPHLLVGEKNWRYLGVDWSCGGKERGFTYISLTVSGYPFSTSGTRVPAKQVAGGQHPRVRTIPAYSLLPCIHSTATGDAPRSGAPVWAVCLTFHVKRHPEMAASMHPPGGLCALSPSSMRV